MGITTNACGLWEQQPLLMSFMAIMGTTTKDTLQNVSVCRVSMLLLMEVAYGNHNHYTNVFMGTTTNGGG